MDRALAPVEALDPRRVDVEADNLVAEPGQGDGVAEPDVAPATDDADPAPLAHIYHDRQILLAPVRAARARAWSRRPAASPVAGLMETLVVAPQGLEP